jgi:hypothetical protein
MRLRATKLSAIGFGGARFPLPSLDLQFATDKTLTARRGPTPTFTRASTATFVGSGGMIEPSTVNAPRFDHDPVTLACKGLLIEEQRTNLTTQSANAGAWASSNGTVTNNGSTTAPDGTAAGYLAGIGTAQLNTPATSSVTGLHTASIFLKRNNSDWMRIQVYQGAFVNSVNFWVNLATGAAGTVAASAGTPTSISAQIVTAGNGWYRCSITASYPNSAGLAISAISATGNNSVTRVAGSVYAIWGAQIEAGSFSTSYIPTTTAAVPRSADVCSITGSDFTGFWNQSAGTLVETFEASPNTNTTYVSASNGNIAQNSLHLDNDTGLMRAVYYSGSLIVAELNLGAVGTVGVVNSIATAYSINNFAASRNGATVEIDTSGAVPASLTQINIGADERSQTPTSFYSNRCIKSLIYLKKRLPNTKLQSITAL